MKNFANSTQSICKKKMIKRITGITVTKIINLYCEGIILHVHKDKTDEMNLQSVARDFCFREYRQNIFGQFK